MLACSACLVMCLENLPYLMTSIASTLVIITGYFTYSGLGSFAVNDGTRWSAWSVATERSLSSSKWKCSRGGTARKCLIIGNEKHANYLPTSVVACKASALWIVWHMWKCKLYACMWFLTADCRHPCFSGSLSLDFGLVLCTFWKTLSTFCSFLLLVYNIYYPAKFQALSEVSVL